VRRPRRDVPGSVAYPPCWLNGGDQARMSRPSITAARNGPGHTWWWTTWSWRAAGPPSGVVGGEVRPDPGVQVGGLPHVEHVTGGIGEPVDTWSVREPYGESQLAAWDGPPDGAARAAPRARDAERSGPLQHGVEEVPGGSTSVRARWTVGGGAGGWRPGSRACSPAPRRGPGAGPGQGVDGPVGQPIPSGGDQGVVEGRRGRSAGCDRPAPTGHELEKDGSISPTRGASATMASLMPVSAVMNGGMRSSAGRRSVCASSSPPRTGRPPRSASRWPASRRWSRRRHHGRSPGGEGVPRSSNDGCTAMATGTL